MSFFVVIRLQVRPDRLAAVVSTIHAEFGRVDDRGHGRRRGHVFQRIGRPTDLLGCIEWESQAAYAAYRLTATHKAILAGLSAPSHSRYCVRLASYERMLVPSDVAACIEINVGTGDVAAAERAILGEGRTESLDAPGLVCHEVYRTLKSPPHYVVMHRWQSLADVERFRLEMGERQERLLTRMGATLERFTGHLTATCPPVDD